MLIATPRSKGTIITALFFSSSGQGVLAGVLWDQGSLKGWETKWWGSSIHVYDERNPDDRSYRPLPDDRSSRAFRSDRNDDSVEGGGREQDYQWIK